MKEADKEADAGGADAQEEMLRSLEESGNLKKKVAGGGGRAMGRGPVEKRHSKAG